MNGWRYWLSGIAATFINGFASGVVLIIADPMDFNLETGLKKLLATSALLGILGAANFLKQHPVPKWDGVDRREGMGQNAEIGFGG